MRKPVLVAALLAALTGAAPTSAAPESTAPASMAGDHAMEALETALAMGFLAALGRLDFDAAGAMLDEEAVLELPFAGDGLTVRGRDTIVQFFRRTMAGSVGAIEYRLVRAYPSPAAGALVLEIATQGRTAAGRDYENRLVGVFEFRGGKIVLFREYFNPAPLG